MTISAGTVLYKANVLPVEALGISYSDQELDDALSVEVREIVYDVSGRELLAEIIESIEGTGFSDSELKAFLNPEALPEDWRVGEGLAQAYLVAHRGCSFPWPASRDLRNPVSSPAGTDLVGFAEHKSDYFFAFGEVKTSTEQKWPPSLIYGRHGLKQQLEDLRDSTEHKDALVRYLGLHSVNASWIDLFKRAFKRYTSSKTNVAIFGLLIRDVTPNSEDLSARTKSLAKECPQDSRIELIAIYLPSGAIPTLPHRSKKGGAKKQ
jgi:hypothetical protein